jgi:glycerophosphoryl diester phosphodiesterase
MSDQKKNLNYFDLKRPAIFAHRGSSAYAPENTLASFELAVKQHADAIELDATLSADGQVVVIHDDTVDRTTNGTGLIKSLDLSELKFLDAGVKFNPTYQSERIPTLAEVFEAVGQQILIDVELKNYTSPTDDLPDRVIALVKKYALQSSVMLSSLNLIALIRARSLLPEITLGLITLPGFASITLRSRLVRLGPLFALHPNYKDVTPALVNAAHRTKSRVHAFTVNLPEDMRRLFNDGVDGIFTPDPLMAQKVLAEIP